MHVADTSRPTYSVVGEEDGEWRRADVYSFREKPECICLHFTGTEYEGLPGGSYRLDVDAGRLFDGDGEQIDIRNLVHML
jgi:hypothetical protein